MLIVAFASMKAADVVQQRTIVLNVGECKTEQYYNLSSIKPISNDAIATTNHDFYNDRITFTGMKRGKASILVEALIKDPYTTSYEITYTINVVDVVSITLPSTLALTVGDEYTFNPIIAAPEAKTTFIWQSFNTDAATFNNEGKLTAVSIGTAHTAATTPSTRSSAGLPTTCQKK